MLSLVNKFVLPLLLVLISFSSYGQIKCENSNEVATVVTKGTNGITGKPSNIKGNTVSVKGEKKEVKSINKKKRKSTHVTTVENDNNAAKKVAK